MRTVPALISPVVVFLLLPGSPARAQLPPSSPAPKGVGGSASTTPPTARKVVAQLGVDLTPDDQRLLAGYRLSLDKLDKFEAATKKLQEAVKRDPLLKSQLESAGSAAGKPSSLSESIGRVEVNSPAVVSLLKEAGTSPRDFILTPFSLYIAGRASVAKQGNPAVTLPPYAPSENVAFFEANRARVAAVFQNNQGQAR